MNYYYLIAGLPDLSLGVDSKKLDFAEVIDTIKRNLEPSDEQLFRYLLYPNDNRNLLNILFEKHKEFPKAEFISPAIHSEQDIREYHKNKGMFPVYMGEFLIEFEDQFQSMSMHEMEDRLSGMFDEEVEHQDAFIAAYHRFEKELKVIFAAYNYSYFDFLTTPTWAEDTVLAQVGKGKSVPIDLLRTHPYLEDIGEAISTYQPSDIEKLMYRLKWDYLDETYGFFGKEQVFAYVVKLLMVWRWQTLMPEKGTTRFNKLQEEIKTKVRSFKTPVI